MSRTVKYLLWANLGVIAVLVFVFPHLMISPGRVLDGHAALATDCFACHVPLLGASSDKCVACHQVASIGVLTSKGVPLSVKKTKTPFHQKLLGQDCVACHSDHAGVAKYRSKGRFSHQLLEEATRTECLACHARPADPLHQQASDQCGQCHTVTRWKPAAYDHDKLFAFDRKHNVKCLFCHPGDDYKKYTCYECHEHSVAKIRKEHLEEGIQDYERCVLCHRNADEDDAKRLWRSGRWREGLTGDASLPPEGGARLEQRSGHDDEHRDRKERDRERRRKHKDHDDD